MIPLIDITPLHGADGAQRRATDVEIMRAATGSGFITVTADAKLLPATHARRAEMLKLFSLPAPEKRKALAAEIRAGAFERLSRLFSACCPAPRKMPRAMTWGPISPIRGARKRAMIPCSARHLFRPRRRCRVGVPRPPIYYRALEDDRARAHGLARARHGARRALLRRGLRGRQLDLALPALSRA